MLDMTQLEPPRVKPLLTIESGVEGGLIGKQRPEHDGDKDG